MTNVLLVGRFPVVVEDARREIGDDTLEFAAATSLDEVRAAFGKATFDHVVMGAGLDIEVRLAVVREVFRRSETTTVHLKDFASGPGGFLPFARAVLTGLAAYRT